MEFYGFMGKILIINLTNKTYKCIEIDEDIYREYIGGYGLGVRILFERMKSNIDPLGAENILGFVAGPLVGTKSHGAGRFNVVAKSPLTNGWGDSSCGGNFGPAIKSCGYDGVFVLGQSNKPIYLLITDNIIEFRDASHMWGRDTLETEKIIKKEVSRKLQIISIGKAGENLSKISGIIHDHGRAAARSGLGAVMGSKKLKAVAMCGSKKVQIKDQEGFQLILKRMLDDFRKGSRLINVFSTLGTSNYYHKAISIQDAPIQNWKGISKNVYSMGSARKISGDSYIPYKKRKYACAQCLIGCGAILDYQDSEGTHLITHRPEYESIVAFGSLCLIDDIETIIKANELCNLYGFDTMSTGATIAFAMECYEKGILSIKDTEGIKLEWGNKNVILPLIEQMSKREGIGSLLADGVKAASKKIGKGSEEFAFHIGGQEPSYHDPRCWPGFGYTYILDATPGRHTQSGIGNIEHGWWDKNLEKYNDEYKLSDLPTEKYNYSMEKGEAIMLLSNWYHFFNSTGICIFVNFGYNHYPLIEAIQTVIGWKDFNIDKALIIGERINTLRHYYNLREGIRPSTFDLPKRLKGEPPLTDGPTAGVVLNTEIIKKSYYNALDWDINSGKPSINKLKKLNLYNLVNTFG